MLLIGILVQTLASIEGNIARLTMYFEYSIIFLIPNIIEEIDDKKIRIFLKCIVYILLTVYFVISIQNSTSYIPYKMFMFQEEKLKILIIGDLYSANLGDGIICENVKEIIKKENSEQKLQIKLVDIYCKNGYIKDDKSQANVKRNNISDFIRSIIYKSEFITYKIQDIKTKKRIKKICEEHYDLAIFAGGHLFIPYFTFQIYNFVKYLS